MSLLVVVSAVLIKTPLPVSSGSFASSESVKASGAPVLKSVNVSGFSPKRKEPSANKVASAGMNDLTIAPGQVMSAFHPGDNVIVSMVNAVCSNVIQSITSFSQRSPV